jgi:hypothetical protein
VTPGHLLDDLAGGQVALETALPGGAEAARHRASGLRADADGRTVVVVHQHGLDVRAVVQAPEPLDRLAVVADGFGRRREGRGQLDIESRAQGLRERRQLTGIRELLVQPPPHLLDAIVRLAVEERGHLVAIDVVAGGGGQWHGAGEVIRGQ